MCIRDSLPTILEIQLSTQFPRAHFPKRCSVPATTCAVIANPVPEGHPRNRPRFPRRVILVWNIEYRREYSDRWNKNTRQNYIEIISNARNASRKEFSCFPPLEFRLTPSRNRLEESVLKRFLHATLATSPLFAPLQSLHSFEIAAKRSNRAGNMYYSLDSCFLFRIHKTLVRSALRTMRFYSPVRNFIALRIARKIKSKTNFLPSIFTFQFQKTRSDFALLTEGVSI